MLWKSYELDKEENTENYKGARPLNIMSFY